MAGSENCRQFSRPEIQNLLCRSRGSNFPARQNGDFGRNFAYFTLIFRLFYSALLPHLPFLSPHVYGIHLFPPISVYFLPKMVPHPCYKLKLETHLMLFCPHVYRLCLFSADFPPIFLLTFCPYSVGPVLPGYGSFEAILCKLIIEVPVQPCLCCLRYHIILTLTKSGC